MRYRKLRIAWSVVWGVVAVLLIVVWRLHGATYLNGHFPSVSRFNITSYCFSDSKWKDTVSFYVIFGWDSRNDSQWEIGRALGLGGGLPEGFDIKIDNGHTGSIYAPHWFLVLLSASVGVIPWMAVIFRVRRFSLRTLLIVTMLFAIGLYLLVTCIKHSSGERQIQEDNSSIQEDDDPMISLPSPDA
jgi:hypothetical protein